MNYEHVRNWEGAINVPLAANPYRKVEIIRLHRDCGDEFVCIYYITFIAMVQKDLACRI
jgi:hypothetical protein